MPSRWAIRIWAVVALAMAVGLLTGTAAAQPTPGPVVRPTHAYVGETLTVTPGTYPGGGVTTDEWDRCDPISRVCAPTGTTGLSYTVTNADVGYILAVVETNGPFTMVSNPTSMVTGLPTNLAPPVIGGAPVVGTTLTATQGTWLGASSISDTWEDCVGSTCTPIPGTTTTTPTTSYTLTSADLGHTIEVVETADGVTTVSSAPTRVVHMPGTPATGSSLSLTVAPASPVTDQGVILAATVTSQAAAGKPSGSVAFLNRGTPIPGCGAVPLPVSGQSATVICQTSFGAGSQQLTAIFRPAARSLVVGSASAGRTLTVARDTAATTVDVSPQVPVYAATTYTATVAPRTAPGGPIQPAGAVEFLDGGKPIAGCTAQPVVTGGATCVVRYLATGSHSIVAQYLGDANFGGSSSAAKSVSVTPLALSGTTSPASHGSTPLSFKGTITSTMQWMFGYTPTYTRVITMVINGVPTGATVQTRCHGRGCPFARRSITIRRAKPCTGKRKRTHSCPVHGRVSLAAPFRHHKLRPGAQITIEIRRPQFLGKYYSFKVRASRPPRVRIGCLAVGGTRPNVGC